MTLEVRADEPAIPRPVIFGVRSRMDADESASTVDECFKRRLFHGVQDIPGRVQEDDDTVFRQVGLVEHRCFFRVHDGKTVFVSQGSNRRDAGWNRVVPKSDRKSTRLNSSHTVISYAVFCLKKKSR